MSSNYGRALLYENETEEAIDKLKQSFEIDEKLKNKRGMDIVTPYLVRALRKTNRRDEADEYIRRALAVAPDNQKIMGL